LKSLEIGRVTETMLMAALPEEVLFRAVLIGVGMSKMRASTWTVGIVSGMVFAAAHGDLGRHLQLGEGIGMALSRIVSGMLYARIFVKEDGGLWPAVICHSAHNALAGVFVPLLEWRPSAVLSLSLTMSAGGLLAWLGWEWRTRPKRKTV
jgi:membrane protease YdiL (CAAX protease family)